MTALVLLVFVLFCDADCISFIKDFGYNDKDVQHKSAVKNENISGK